MTGVQTCALPICKLKTPIHAHGFSTSTYTPMECLNIDFIGPFPDGRYVLVNVSIITRARLKESVGINQVNRQASKVLR